MEKKGYRVTHRNRWALITQKILTQKEFLLFEYYLDIMDWDPEHKKYGFFEVYLDDIAPVFKVSTDAIRIWNKGLVNKRFIKLLDKKHKQYAVKNPSRYLLDGRGGNKASTFTGQESIEGNFEIVLVNMRFPQEKNEKNQKKELTTASSDGKPLASSKVGNSVDLEFVSLSEEDINWINNNVKEGVVDTG